MFSRSEGNYAPNCTVWYVYLQSNHLYRLTNMAEKRPPSHVATTRKGNAKVVQVAKLDLVANAKHEIEVKPRPSQAQPGADSKESRHHFMIRTAAGQEHLFKFVVHTEALFVERDDGGRHNKVAICLLVSPLSFASATVSLHRQGKWVAELKSFCGQTIMISHFK